MSADTVQWMLVGHIFGFLMWTGTLFGLYQILLAHGEAGAGAGDAFGPLEKRVAMAMDVGATIAIAFGLILIFGPPNGTAIFKAGGFFHIKLALVVVIIGIHGFVRVKIKKFSHGEVSSPPAVLFPVMSLIVLGIVIMMIVRPFAK
jgi:putative membrane protein